MTNNQIVLVCGSFYHYITVFINSIALQTNSKLTGPTKNCTRMSLFQDIGFQKLTLITEHAIDQMEGLFLPVIFSKINRAVY